jgi:phosphoribosylglycinamide formyltransferase-1
VRLAVLVSGTGSIMAATADRGIEPALVLADRPCPAEGLAEERGLAFLLVDRTLWRSADGAFAREAYSDAVGQALAEREIELVALAGFGTVLAGAILERYHGAMLNTHPSLLPSFPGWHAVAQALAFGVKVTGTTVHLVVPEVDAGPILAQEPVRVAPGDDVASLHERIKETERWLYPSVLAATLRVLAPGRRWWEEESFMRALEEEVAGCVR